jgi:hypothetical protein
MLWLLNEAYFKPSAVLTVNAAQAARLLYISTISAWEVGAALGKKNPSSRPYLKNLPADKWFRAGV